MNRPLVVLTVFFAVGILAGEVTGFKASAALALAAFVFMVAVAGHILDWRENRRVILVLFLLLGLSLSRLDLEESKTPLVGYSGQRVTVTGRVAAEPDVREDKVFYLLEAQEIIKGEERRAVTGTVRLQVKESSKVFGYGDVLKVYGLLATPEPAGNPGAFDYRTYLERQGIRVILTARGKDVQVTGKGGVNLFLDAALKIKQKLSNTAAYSLTPAQAVILNGIIFGVQGTIDRETRRSFSETGLVHILSVSGLHVGLVLGGLIGLFRLFRLPPGLTAPLTTPVLIFYAVMTGLDPAVSRSTIMALLLVWANYLGRDRDWPTTLAVAALVILIWKPLQIYNPGFQLSFAATWGILYLGPVMAGACSGFFKGLPDKATGAAAQGLAIPFAAQLATVPLVAWYYNLISPVSIIANLLAIPLVGLIMLLGVLATVLGLIWLPLAGLVNVGTGITLDLFMALTVFLQRLPGAVIYLATPPVLLAAAWYGGLLAGAKACTGGWSDEARRRLTGWAAVGLAFAMVLLLILWPWSGGHRLKVHFIDVGQGDSILVQTPGGRSMLIDTGGRPDEFQTGTGTGDQVVTPYLRRIGVNRIDALVLTHPHEDHCGGAAYLVDNFPVGLAVVSPVSRAAGEGAPVTAGKSEKIPVEYTALLKRMVAKDIPVRTASAGDTLRLEKNIDIEILSPEAMATKPGLNNDSLVLKLTYGRRSFVFTGDIELEVQKELVGREADLEADVLKMPHHGSRSLLPELVGQVKPEVAVITVGAHNTYGHPAPSTLDLLYQSGVRIYRTDQDGAVIMETEGNKLDVKTGKKTR